MSSAAKVRHPSTTLLIVVGVAFVVAGVVGSALAASAASNVARHDSQVALQQLSEEVAATLRLAIQREEDLVVSAAGYFLTQPDASNAEFAAWSASVRALERYPELLGWGEVVMVPRSDLASFAAERAVDPAAGASPGAPFSIYPSGERPFYCLLRVGQNRDSATGAPAGFDYCGAEGIAALDAQDSGVSTYRIINTGSGDTLVVQVPFYQHGLTPRTIEERRAAFVGWMGMAFDPEFLLNSALRGNSGTAVVFRLSDEDSDVQFTSGVKPERSQSVLIDLRNGWTVETFGSVAESGWLADREAVTILASGVSVSLLLAILILVLGTSRARALRLVDERTRELRQQATHDALTGLPNRQLISDRIDQLLARNRRHHTFGAAMFVDLDNFKNINDTLGHNTGDQLLIAIAARLTTVLREVDTIGRMGGDEFVVLVDGSRLSTAPELIAERLVCALAEPFALEGCNSPLRISASVGVAVGDRTSSGDLLRDADVALYEAKVAGRNCYRVFRPEMNAKVVRQVALDRGVTEVSLENLLVNTAQT